MSADYSFESLNDKDFEALVRDLLQMRMECHIESFARGPDQGIDLRIARIGGSGEAIIQAKHWRGSSFSSLFSHMKNREKKKIDALAPTRYILATSTPLTPAAKAKLMKVLSPYVHSSEDIYGPDDLNNLIQLYPDVEKSHYKLWLSSSTVLQRIINNAVEGRSRFFAKEISNELQIFVPSINMDQAAQILEEHGILLIKGEPGVGKTLLGKALTLQLMKAGYQLYVIDSWKEGEEVYAPEEQQVFYFDDFLGANYVNVITHQSTGSEIDRFLKRVKEDKKKKLILTTRTAILSQAYAYYFQLDRRALTSKEYELFLQDYSRLGKAKILYNHLYFSDLPKPYVDELFKNERYLEIIDHRNYNPRIIEYITRLDLVSEIGRSEYFEWVLETLENPSQIWRSAYQRNIDDTSRLILQTLFSLGDFVDLEHLRVASEGRIRFESQEKGFQPPQNPVYGRIPELQGGFIVTAKVEGNVDKVRFFNPSLVDFLIGYFKEDKSEMWKLIESAEYLEQLSKRFSRRSVREVCLIEGPEEEQSFDDILERKKTSVQSTQLYNRYLVTAAVERAKFHPIPSEIARLLRALFESGQEVEGLSEEERKVLLDLVWRYAGEREFVDLPNAVKHSVLEKLLLAGFRYEDVEEISSILSEWGIDPDTWLVTGELGRRLQDSLDYYWEENLEEVIREQYDLIGCLDLEEAGEIFSEKVLPGLEECNTQLGLDVSPILEDAGYLDGILEDIVYENQSDAMAEEWKSENWDGASATVGASEIDQIRDLFSR